MAQYFITSPGTGVGKTLVTSALAYGLRQNGEDVKAIKPIISGYHFGKDNDLNSLCYAAGLPNSEQSHQAISLYRYEPALSPDMIIRESDDSLDFNELKNFIDRFEDTKNLLVEGIGGALAPLDDKHTVADLIKAVELEAILVCGSYLGSLSHSLAAYQVLVNYGIKIKAVIVTQNIREAVELYIPLKETIKSLSNFIPGNIIELEYIEGTLEQRIVAASQKLKGTIDGL